MPYSDKTKIHINFIIKIKRNRFVALKRIKRVVFLVLKLFVLIGETEVYFSVSKTGILGIKTKLRVIPSNF